MSRRGGFQPKARGRLVPAVPGTRVSIHNTKQLLVSSGIPSLDDMIGGGIPIGTILLLEEDDNHGKYAEFFLKCFLAEGVTATHEVFLASMDKSPENMLQTLPSPVTSQTKEEEPEKSIKSIETNEENMKIAWRYEQKKKHSTENERILLGHHYDLKNDMSLELLGKSEKFLWGGLEKSLLYQADKSRNPYRELFKDLNSLFTRRQLTTGSKRTSPNIMRVGIHSIASLAWGDELNKELKDRAWTELTTFFSLLHALLRESFGVAFVTVPSHLFADYNLMSRLSQTPHCIIKLESFHGAGKELNPVFKDYHGELKIKKLAALNSLVSPPLDAKDWVFKLKRTRLCIEKLHLPPDLSETVSRSQDPVKKNTAASASLCSSGSSQNAQDSW